MCNTEFDKRVNNQKCCSPACVKTWGTIKMKKSYEKKSRESRKFATCETCKLSFDYHYRPDRGDRKFCSRGCASKHYIQNGTFDAWRLLVQPRRGSIGKCDICDSDVYKPPRYAEKSRHVCSKMCLRLLRHKLAAGRNNPMFGRKLTNEQKTKQRATLFANHGVSNAFMLAKHRNVSKAQKEIFTLLSSSYPQHLFMSEQVFKSGSHEYYIDIFSEPLKLIIEYNGDFWHCNPHVYSGSYFHPKKSMSAEEIWASDSARLNVLQNNGYHTMVVWERDYRTDMSGTVVLLKDYINKRCVSG